jgi:UDP-perosamine 4-acetyltransferase
MIDLVIIGASGHAKVVIDLFREVDAYRVIGLIDADPTPRKVLGVPVIGSDSDMDALRGQGVSSAFVAIGDNRLRLKIGRQLERQGFTLVKAVSRRAAISPSALLGAGVAVMAGAVVNAETRLEDLAILNTNASVDHDCRLGEACHVAPGSAIAGNVDVGRLAFLGVGVRAIPGVVIGEGSVVGAGATIVRDLPANTVAMGTPARVIRPYETQA